MNLGLLGATYPAPTVAAMLRGVVDIPARELRNDVSAVLRRVEEGQSMRITVSGRPVAQLEPLPARPGSLPWDALFGQRRRWQADPGLTADLSGLLPETTDDAPSL